MDFLHGYWPAIIVAAALVVIALLRILRPRQRVQLTDSAPVRPHMARSKGPPEGRGLPGEHAAATSDVTGQILRAPVHRELDGDTDQRDDLSRLKGVGPKFADALHGLGFNRFEQLASLTPTEIERLDKQLGAFRGRITRDRVVEQADYLARGDIDGFEQQFGKL
jgi:predicted flap endonuclease-1-like 5' DNA nuclease